MRIDEIEGEIRLDFEGAFLMHDVNNADAAITFGKNVFDAKLNIKGLKLYGYIDEVSYMKHAMEAKEVKGRKLLLFLVKVINWLYYGNSKK